MKQYFKTEDGRTFEDEGSAKLHEEWLKEQEKAKEWMVEYCAKEGLSGKLIDRLAHCATCYSMEHIPSK